MTTIDHRILIPAGPESVWEYVSDITHNPDWQIDCAEVIFLTSRREGPGVRWRYSAPNGHEYVIAVTAWYNGLGYEYYFVDGVPFKENKGRIRLQEIPEGTIVQWTYTYELGGLFGGMRNALGVSRGVDFTISESLKTLYQKIKQTGASSRPHEAKSLMRDAPNVDARSAYQPRHPSIIEEDEAPPPLRPAALPRANAEPPVREGDGQRIRVIAEPPIAPDDTRRRKAAAAQTPPPPPLEDAIPADIEGEPDFLSQLVDLSRFEPPRSPSDTQPRKPITPADEAAPPSRAPVSPFEEAAPPRKPVAPLIPEPLAYPPPSIEDTEPVSVSAAKSSPTEEPTAPAIQVPDETQADYASPARIYDAPAKREPETPPAPTPTPAPEPVSRVFDAPAPTLAPTPAPVQEVAPPVVVPAPEPAPPTPASVQAVPPAAEIKPPAPAVTPTPTPEPLSVRFEPPRSPSDTASIWEVFGIPRPSEVEVTPTPAQPPAQDSPASVPVAAEAPAPAAVEPEAAAPVAEPVTAAPAAVVDDVVAEAPLPEKLVLPPASTHIGLRVALRRRLVTVRRPD